MTFILARFWQISCPCNQITRGFRNLVVTIILKVVLLLQFDFPIASAVQIYILTIFDALTWLYNRSTVEKLLLSRTDLLLLCLSQELLGDWRHLWLNLGLWSRREQVVLWWWSSFLDLMRRLSYWSSWDRMAWGKRTTLLFDHDIENRLLFLVSFLFDLFLSRHWLDLCFWIAG